MRKSERQLHFQSWKTLSDADVWDGLDIFHEWITIDFRDKLCNVHVMYMGTRGFQEEARSTATELERCRQERSQENGHQLGRGWRGCRGQEELEESCCPMRLWRGMNQEHFKTLKSDTSLPPVNRTTEIQHHWVMGGKKEIYKDVQFFHRAFQMFITLLFTFIHHFGSFQLTCWN